MRRGYWPIGLVLATLLALVVPCEAYVAVSLPNGDITDFTSGVASGWSSFVTGSAVPSVLQFFPDYTGFRSSPCSQGISGIDQPQAPGALFGVGLTRGVDATPGKVYLLIGYQDLFDPSYSPPPARRYAHFFGIDPTGKDAPTQAFAMGSVCWMGADQWFYNDAPGNSTQVGGMHRCMAAWPARATRVGIWSGVHVYGDAPAAIGPTIFDTDAFALFEFDNPVRSELQNPGFEVVDNLTPGLDPNDVSRTAIPTAWVPIGGGIGQKESYYADGYAKRSGTAGLRIYNHRGCLTRGVMQRVATQPGASKASFSVWVRSNPAGGTVARVGIDPTGGDDIRSSAIVWSEYSRTDESWEQVSVSAACASAPITLFLSASNNPAMTGYIHYADFDDAALAFQADTTPPEPFDVDAPGVSTLTGFLSAAVHPAPSDPESGISRVEYAIGAIPGGQEIRSYAACPDPASVSAAGLRLSPGQVCYIAVRATNGAGLSTTASSGPILISPRPYTYAWHDGGHLSQTGFNADNVRLACDLDSRICAVWRESNDATWTGSDSAVVLRERTGSCWSAPKRINSSPNAWWPDVAAAPGATIVSYVALLDGATGDLHVATRSALGAFVDEPTVPGAAAFPRIAWAQAGWAVGCSLRTSSAAPGSPALVTSRLAESLPGVGASWASAPVSVARFGADAHCLWTADQGGEPALYYSRRDSAGSYTTPVLVATGAESGCIAVGLDGDIHVVYQAGGGVWYARSSSYVSFDPPQCVGQGRYPGVTVEASGRVHVLFFSDTGTSNEHGVALVVPVHMFLDQDGWSEPAAICSPSCTSGSEMELPGNLTVDAIGGLHFAWSNNPHDQGWQSGDFAGYYWIDYYTTTPVESSPGDIAAAKLWGDDVLAERGGPPSKTVTLTGKAVTAVGSFRAAIKGSDGVAWKSVPCFYIEEADRSSGIRVMAGSAADSPFSPSGVKPGDFADVTGVLSTIGGERTIGCLAADGAAAGVEYSVKAGYVRPPAPLLVRVRDLGGAPQGPTPGPIGGAGANNVGLLVRIAGIVIADELDERGVRVLTIDDGSQPPGSGPTGCRVYAPETRAALGDTVVITGASSLEALDPISDLAGDGTYVRVLMPADPSAIRIVGP